MQESSGDHSGLRHRFDRVLLAVILWLMAAVYFFLFFAASYLWDNLFQKYLGSSSGLFKTTLWAYYVFIDSWLLAVLPIVFVVAGFGILLVIVPERSILRCFLMGLCVWLWGLLMFSFCSFVAAMPFAFLGGGYTFRYPGLFTTWIAVFFILPPLLVAYVALKQLFKKGSDSAG